ncbi:MAG: hypothetical protein J6V97_07055 [Prevotella sp.]|nr:hypothetical protein [Prevotella sp.]MBO7109837.1 hypothetical protein [Prevotella sp.]
MKEIYYKVADHVFALETGSNRNVVCSLRQYEPFVTDPTEDTVFRLRLNTTPLNLETYTMEMQQEDEGQSILAGNLGGKPCFQFFLHNQLKGVLVSSSDFRLGELYTEDFNLFGINNALMVMYALSTAHQQTALFHSSVVSHQGKAYMFLGVSGTGKSTHSSLWLKHIEGTELMNDDNPVVRILDDGSIRVYGSPWSGKTPCYRNVSYPLGAIVNLSQAPENRIRRLKPIEAYAALMMSISGMRWNKQLAEGLHETENLIVSHANIWHLECLPNEEAARVCQEAVHG